MKRTMLGLFLICILSGAICGPAKGQKPYPEKAIDLIVAFNPGGGTDVSARLISLYLAQEWKVPVNVVNKPGAVGILGTRDVIVSKPDGYTMLCDGHATSTIMDAFSPTKLPFDWRNRTFVCRQTADVVFYVVRPDAPWKNLKELAKWIKENPKKLKWGESGIGLAAGAQFFAANNIPVKDVNRVSFTGGSMTNAALAGSHIDFGAQQLSESIGMIQGKKIRALAVLWPKRLPQLPDVPTVSEQDYPMLDAHGWSGISGPPGLPEDIAKKWANTLEKASNDPMFIKMADAVLKMSGYLNQTQFKEFVEREHKKYVELAKTLGVK